MKAIIVILGIVVGGLFAAFLLSLVILWMVKIVDVIGKRIGL